MPAPVDKIPNPTILVTIGEFGDRVLERLEKDLEWLGEDGGRQALRNLERIRVLLGAERRRRLLDSLVFPKERERRSSTDILFVNGPMPGIENAFKKGAAGFSSVYWKPDATPADMPPAEAFVSILRDKVARLFDINRFVDIIPDKSPFGGRVEIHFVFDGRDRLGAGAIGDLLASATELLRGEFGPIFKDFSGNVFMTVLVALPVLASRSSAEVAGAFIEEAAARLEDSFGSGLPELRFYVVEDRSGKYVIPEDDIEHMFSNFIFLLVTGEPGKERVLDELLRADQAFRKKLSRRLFPSGGANRAERPQLRDRCGATFAQAIAEYPTRRVFAYCANRQAIELLASLRKETVKEKMKETYETALEEYTLDSSLGKAVEQLWEENGRGIAGEGGFLRGVLDQVLLHQRPESWKRIEPFEDHTNVAPPSHSEIGFDYHAAEAEAEERNGSYFYPDVAWHRKLKNRLFTRELHERPPDRVPRVDEHGLETRPAGRNDLITEINRYFIKDVLASINAGGEKILMEKTGQLRAYVDRLVSGSASGWSDALDLLEKIKLRMDEGLKTVRMAADVNLPGFPLKELDAITSAYAEFRAGLTLKPHKLRLRDVGIGASLFAGLALAGLLGLVPMVGNYWAMAPVGAAAAAVLAWFILKKYNLHRWRPLVELADEPAGGSLREFDEDEAARRGEPELYRLFEQARKAIIDERELLDCAALGYTGKRVGPAPASYFGSRLVLAHHLWTIRIFESLLQSIETDIARLKEIGEAIEAQIAIFRHRQEELGVRFIKEKDVEREDLSLIFGSSPVFRQQLLDEKSAGKIYAAFAGDGLAASRQYILERKPFERWREELPFSDTDDLDGFCKRPFERLRSLVIFDHEALAATAEARLAGFLGDFIHKMDTQLDVASLPDGGQGEFDSYAYVLVHPDNEQRIKRQMELLSGSRHWTVKGVHSDRNRITLLKVVAEIPLSFIRTLSEGGKGENP